mmetsp:Transcript_4534/g.16250  ORF Transcript_4534/g.16250 Transcript_4534/m.16250 type:complete len:593 (-) Transcript_4534:23-1801(-)
MAVPSHLRRRTADVVANEQQQRLSQTSMQALFTGPGRSPLRSLSAGTIQPPSGQQQQRLKHKQRCLRRLHAVLLAGLALALLRWFNAAPANTATMATTKASEETRGTANDAGAASNEGGHDVQQLLETYERWHAAQLEALGSNVSHAASSSRTQQQQHDDDSIGDGDGAAALSPFRLHSDASSVGVVLWRPKTGLAAALDALAITAMVALCTGRLLLVEIGGWEAALASPLDWRWDERKQQLLKEADVLDVDGRKIPSTHLWVFNGKGDDASCFFDDGSTGAGGDSLDNSRTRRAPHPYRYSAKVCGYRMPFLPPAALLQWLVRPSARVQELMAPVQAAMRRARVAVGLQLRTGKADGRAFAGGYLSADHVPLFARRALDYVVDRAHDADGDDDGGAGAVVLVVTDHEPTRLQVQQSLRAAAASSSSSSVTVLSIEDASTSGHSLRAASSGGSGGSGVLGTAAEFFLLGQAGHAFLTQGSNFGRMALVYGGKSAAQLSYLGLGGRAWAIGFADDFRVQQQARGARRGDDGPQQDAASEDGGRRRGAEGVYVLEYRCGVLRSVFYDSLQLVQMDRSDPYLHCPPGHASALASC